MITETTEKLMWEKIDGTISPQDNARLDDVMSRDVEARECFGELMRLSELLGTVEELDPPPALRERIEEAIDFDRDVRRDRRMAASWRGWFPLHWDLRVAVAAAAGLAIGIVGYHLFVYGGSVDRSRLVGTIAPANHGHEINLSGVSGTIAFREDDKLAVSVLDITSESDIDVLLEYKGPPVHFEAAGRDGRELPDMSVSGNTLMLNKLGHGRYAATFRRDAGSSPLRVVITLQGVVLFDEQIAPDRRR